MPSEFGTRPTALLVCDATARGAFSSFSRVDSRNVERALLFRHLPVLEDYRREHAAFDDRLV